MYAQKIARNVSFKKIKLIRVLLIETTKNLKVINKSELSILYVCEPTSQIAKKMYNDENYFGYTEVDALKYFLKNIDRLGKKFLKYY